ncbi:4-hydroxybenzoate octaprenyltransferase [Candidatus Nitrospira neomarina]|uniref:4-hydroxybenzoate octaprenyltransferase n=1 Tax=Candidatus Nitrospira neomarina TaxID=3020899 RepID=A0AA96GHC5_9BACT|nr:4-hydroxybenzoate octaprenyltransferase [Candidatus Nitrospira neomarina]WNM61538.1 4-hydroxybenzoate octaprenyltransferase [Candidatus Nitrospira neomarina]
MPSSVAFANLIRLFNQTGTLLLLFPTLWSLFLASEGWPSLKLLMIFILGSFLMRSAGVIMNDLADRSFDREVQRTRHRPLASGQLTPSQAVAFLAVLLGLAAILLLFLNPLTLALSPVALVLAGGYPFCKRFIHVPQFVLGLAFGWGGVLAWAAVRNELDLSAWILFAATVCWAMVYDTIYAIQDKDDDQRIGVKSTAILFGSFTWLGVGIAALFMLGCLALVARINQLGVEYSFTLGGVAVILGYQVLLLRSNISGEKALSLFKQHIWIGILILGGILMGLR